MLCSACMLLYCLLWRRVRSRQSNAGTLPRTNYGSWPIFATLLSIGSNTLHQFLKHFTLLRCTWYTSSIYMTATKNQNRTTLFSSRPKDKATRSGVDGEFAKTLCRQKSSWAFSSLALSHTFSPISYRLPCSSAFPPTGEKFENHQTAKWSKWPTICPAKLIWVVYLSRNV